MLPSTADAISLYAVSYKYSHTDKIALSEICYSFTRGMTAIVRPNGAGKSTLVKLLTGLLTPTSGWISVLLPDGARVPPEELHKAVLSQQPSHLYLTTPQNTTMPVGKTPTEHGNT